MRRRLVPALRGALVFGVGWGVLATFVHLTFEAVGDGGSEGATDSARVLELGITAFVVCVAALIGSYVAGAGLVEARVPRTVGSACLAWSVPVVLVLLVRSVSTFVAGPDRAVDIAFGAAAVAGGLAGAVVSVIRARDDEDSSFAGRARRSRQDHGMGWRTR